MTYQSAPFWWITCDAPSCDAKSTEGADTVAWSDQDGAWEDANDSDWVRNGNDGNDELHYCDDHRRYVCGECDKSEGREYPLEQEGMCDECWAEDAEQNHGVQTVSA